MHFERGQAVAPPEVEFQPLATEDSIVSPPLGEQEQPPATFVHKLLARSGAVAMSLAAFGPATTHLLPNTAPVAADTAPSSAVESNGTYGDYSLMFKPSSGQYMSGNVYAGSWAWTPVGPATSEIQWGSSLSWPAPYAEEFVHKGDWVELSGYSTYSPSSGAGFSKQVIASESMGNADCKDMQLMELGNDSMERYVLWDIPPEGYCLDTKGYINTPTGNVEFEHEEVWSPPAPCANAYLQNETCISQTESWSDDNGHPFSFQFTRTQEIAKGLGMAFSITKLDPATNPPTPWNAAGDNYALLQTGQ